MFNREEDIKKLKSNSFKKKDNELKTKSAVSGIKSKTKKQGKDKKRGSGKKEKMKVPHSLKTIGGLFLVFVSIYFLLAFISFFVNWFNSNPDNIVNKIFGLESYFSDHATIVRNWTGKLGEFFADVFIKKGVGLGAFFLAFLIFDWGIKLLSKIKILKVWSTVQLLILGFLWLPVLMSSIFSGYPDNILGGLSGYYLSQWINGLIGTVGVIIVLIFIPAVFVLVDFNLFAKKHRKKEKIKEKDKKSSVTTTFPKEDKYNTVEFSVTEDETLPVLPDGEERKQEIEEEIPGKKQAQKEDIELTIEKPKEEAKVKTNKPEQGAHTGIDTEYDPRMDLPDFKFPGLDLLNEYNSDTVKIDREELNANKQKIVKTLKDYHIEISSIKATIGPTITLYEIVPAPGVRISKIRNLEDDIALNLSAMGIRIIAPMPGKGTIGIEVPNRHSNIVSMKSILESERFQNSNMELPLGLGKTISNESYVVDLAKMPHILMAGATGQGKSVGLNAIITSLLYKKHPAELKFVMVDPKKVELTLYSRIERHYLAKLPDSEEAIITDLRKVVRTLNSLSIEMDNRYELLKDAQVRNIKEYNKKFTARKLNPLHGHRFLPYIVLVIDEFADLIMTAGKEVENPITRLAQLARAVGIHLVIATQRPSVNIITGTIKANFPARIAYRVIQKVDSRTILDTGGADQLVGKGDMLLATGSDLIRLQCAFIDTEEVERITDFIGLQRGYPDAMHLPEYFDEEQDGPADVDLAERDPLFEDAARLIVQTQQGSTSLLQRKLKLGYNRAGRIIDQLEAAGIVGPFEGSKAREVKVANEMALEQFLKDLNSKENTNDNN
jgi:S-DNA-T family DNA segregation ATPase FtsK/SpoIIIE